MQDGSTASAPDVLPAHPATPRVGDVDASSPSTCAPGCGRPWLVGRLLDELVDRGRVLSQARRAVFVEAANQPVLRAEVARAQEEITSWMAPLLAGLGSATPRQHVHHLLGLMDGLLGNQLVNPMTDFDPAAAVAALLRGLLSA